jgi:photosystem II Psb27 protein
MIHLALKTIGPFVSIQEAVTTSRSDFLKIAGGAALVSAFAPTPAALAEIVVPVQSTAYEFPTNWGLTFRYEEDAAKVRSHMVVATGLAKGADKMEDFGRNMKKEMVDFVSYYRRFPKVAGKPSFSTLYTSINVLAGHYTSYGFKYPLPEKRRKRLYQEYAEIEKSLKRNR